MNSDIFTDAFRKRMEEEDRRDAERKAATEDATINAFKKLTGQDIGPGQVDGNQITLTDGVWLKTWVITMDGDTYRNWAVRGNCPICGEQCWSQSIYAGYNQRTTEQIGEMIMAFRPEPHACNGKKRNAFSWQARLTQALSDAIDELQPRGERDE